MIDDTTTIRAIRLRHIEDTTTMRVRRYRHMSKHDNLLVDSTKLDQVPASLRAHFEDDPYKEFDLAETDHLTGLDAAAAFQAITARGYYVALGPKLITTERVIPAQKKH